MAPPRPIGSLTGRLVFGLTVALAAATPVAAAPPDDGLGAIDIVIQSPPVLETDLDFRLLIDGDDVRADRCRSATISYVTDAQVFRCDALPDGDYTLELGPLPDGWFGSRWDCSEAIGASVFAPQPTIGSGPDEADHWLCTVAASSPVIAAEFQPGEDVPAEPGGFGYTFVSADGDESPAACEPSLDFAGPTPCHLVEPGVYTMRVDGVPDGYRVETRCNPSALWLPFGQNSVETPDARVTTELPWWVCTGSAWAAIVVQSADADAITLTGPDGIVDGACRPVRDGTWHCVGIADGIYHLDATEAGEPRQVTCTVVDESEPSAPFFMDDPSGDVTVEGLEPEQCVVGSSPPVVVATTQPEPGDQLPSTGAPTRVAASAATVLLAVGLACLWLAGRRRPV